MKKVAVLIGNDKRHITLIRGVYIEDKFPRKRKPSFPVLSTPVTICWDRPIVTAIVSIFYRSWNSTRSKFVPTLKSCGGEIVMSRVVVMRES